MSLYLSRLTINSRVSEAALKSFIEYQSESESSGLYHHAQGRAMDAHHHLIWTLFGDSRERKRDFLWRAERNGRFLILSARPPDNHRQLFTTPEIKEFQPNLRTGDHLYFKLLANATRASHKTETSKRTKRVDVVMNAIHNLPPGEERAQARFAQAQEAGTAWLGRQGEKAGFNIQQCCTDDYSVIRLPSHQGTRKGQPQFGVISLKGKIRVTEPERFISHITQGFGQAKAFGCGLMLIRRA